MGEPKTIQETFRGDWWWIAAIVVQFINEKLILTERGMKIEVESQGRIEMGAGLTSNSAPSKANPLPENAPPPEISGLRRQRQSSGGLYPSLYTTVA
jgi:hypothetical protein